MDKNENLTQNDLILYLHAAAAFQVLHAGVELKIFELLYESELNAQNISKKIKIKEDSLRTLLFGLVSLRLITVKNDLYQNCEPIKNLFKRNEWALFKSMVKIQAHIMYIGQIDYVESLKKNKNVGVKRFNGNGATIYERLNYDSKLKNIFYNYMETYSQYANPHLIKSVDFSKDKSMLDIGGGGGINAISITKNNPNLKITIFDLSVAENLAKKKIKQNGLSNRINFLRGDMFKDEFPKGFDVVSFIHQLVIWSERENEILLKKAYSALNKNGKVIIFSSISEDDEGGSVMAALDTVYFRAVAAGSGMIYPWKDYEKLLKKAGFKNIKKIRCNTWTPHGIVIGYK